jgi:murein DD-endopeptidase MepM/ murein hydrolase activator NlpD
MESSSRGVVATYEVQGGDSLSGIADILADDVAVLQNLNNLADPNTLQVGRVLIVPDLPTRPVRFGNAPPKVRLNPDAPAFVWPAFGPITTKFGVPGSDWIGGFHMGLDIGASAGSPIAAAAPGLVEAAEFDHSHGYGNYVLIDHGNGYETLYAHMSRIAATPGSSVQQGELIGYVGATGYAFGPHLHFEVRHNGEKIDPEPLLP